MNSRSRNYPVCLILSGRKYFLLWEDGGDAPDEYVTEPNSVRFLLAETAEKLAKEARAQGLVCADEAVSVINMDRMFSALAALRPRRRTSQAACQILLDGWNALEDLARSLRIALDRESMEQGKVLGIAYDKLFFGNNLPAITAENPSYSPLFSADERKAMRAYLRRLYREIIQKSGQFQN